MMQVSSMQEARDLLFALLLLNKSLDEDAQG
jgi:hypothetical protein